MSFDQVETLLIIFAMKGPYVSEKEIERASHEERTLVQARTVSFSSSSMLSFFANARSSLRPRTVNESSN